MSHASQGSPGEPRLLPGWGCSGADAAGVFSLLRPDVFLAFSLARSLWDLKKGSGT